ncbi:hypothetical protein ATE84_2136 [Aquimarina sp. MAR_2010_214]|uniref:hypothetical protein n=1 Tax=Aquimarina sp. MAR_2010_214 TaxID=1250026 RepID=UPI000C706D6C|nr:hypothetical protein [Aquimarina sp. MAR_2010_214]PKV50087.1 hypothetical protein ATE84_2136 [Aquimarina sp. MAR_2010_214]
MKFFFLLVLSLISTITIGQETIFGMNSDPNNNLKASPFGTTIVVRQSARNTSIKGHQYFEEIDEMATVYIDKKSVRKCLVRYNAFNGELEYLDDNNKRFNMLKISNLEVDLKKYSYKLFDYEGSKQFFIVYNKGAFSLGMKVLKKIKQGKEGATSYDKSTPSKYVEKSKYFIVNNEKGEVQKVKLKKKDILKVLDKKEELEKFASSKKLKFKKEKDLIRIINYYNSL